MTQFRELRKGSYFKVLLASPSYLWQKVGYGDATNTVAGVRSFSPHQEVVPTDSEGKPLPTPGKVQVDHAPTLRYIVDGHEYPDSDAQLVGDGQYAPYLVFDIEEQRHLGTEWPNRQSAEAEAKRLSEEAPVRYNDNSYANDYGAIFCALQHVHEKLPHVVKVTYEQTLGVYAQWSYKDAAGDEVPDDFAVADIDLDLLNAAAEAAYRLGTPAAYKLPYETEKVTKQPGECGRCGSMPGKRDATCPECSPNPANIYAEARDIVEALYCLAPLPADVAARLGRLRELLNAPAPEPVGTHVVAYGDIFEGAKLFGPFASHDAARNWAKFLIGSWSITELEGT